jgi:hypothetical protein
MFAFISAMQQDGGLTFGEFVRDIPHDAGAFVIYAMLAGFIALIVAGSRTRGRDAR